VRTFVLASFLGMIPSSFVYAGIGAGLGHIFAQGGPVTLETLFSPRIYLPIIGMGVLAFLPPLWRHWRKGRVAPDASGREVTKPHDRNGFAVGDPIPPRPGAAFRGPAGCRRACCCSPPSSSPPAAC
jgi:hypothetical protein